MADQKRPAGDVSDRKRLAQMQQTDLAEGRLNEDFVQWLKTSGPNWLLGVLVVLCAFMGWNWWTQRKASSVALAWEELAGASIPPAMVEIASRNEGEPGVRMMALLNAADTYMSCLQTGVRWDRKPEDADKAVTPELRAEYLGKADELYAQVITEATTPTTKAVFAVPAAFGRATVAESEGKLALAKERYEQAASLANDAYPQLAAQAKARIESLASLETPVFIPEPPAPPAPPAAPVPAVDTPATAPVAPAIDPPTTTPVAPATDAPATAPAAPAPAPAATP
ncbi:MAG: hypothetical protein FJ270_05095 [Planctomycetes bacterium]|nr:hypothetical protein [Planctomycetota bacterium]